MNVGRELLISSGFGWMFDGLLQASARVFSFWPAVILACVGLFHEIVEAMQKLNRTKR